MVYNINLHKGHICQIHQPGQRNLEVAVAQQAEIHCWSQTEREGTKKKKGGGGKKNI